MRATPTPITNHLAWLAVVAFVLFATPGQRLLSPVRAGGEVSVVNAKAGAGALKALVSAAGAQRVLGMTEDCGAGSPVTGPSSTPRLLAVCGECLALQPACALPYVGVGPRIIRTIELRI